MNNKVKFCYYYFGYYLYLVCDTTQIVHWRILVVPQHLRARVADQLLLVLVRAVNEL